MIYLSHFLFMSVPSFLTFFKRTSVVVFDRQFSHSYMTVVPESKSIILLLSLSTGLPRDRRTTHTVCTTQSGGKYTGTTVLPLNESKVYPFTVDGTIQILSNETLFKYLTSHRFSGQSSDDVITSVLYPTSDERFPSLVDLKVFL